MKLTPFNVLEVMSASGAKKTQHDWVADVCRAYRLPRKGGIHGTIERMIRDLASHTEVCGTYADRYKMLRSGPRNDRLYWVEVVSD